MPQHRGAASEHQQEMVKALSERASLVHSGTVDPSQDNMLKISSDGRKLGLDQEDSVQPDAAGRTRNKGQSVRREDAHADLAGWRS